MTTGGPWSREKHVDNALEKRHLVRSGRSACHEGTKRKVLGNHAGDSDSVSDVEVRRKKNRGTDSGDESDPSVKSKECVSPRDRSRGGVSPAYLFPSD